MTVLSNEAIRERLADGSLVVSHLKERDIQPASIDLYLDKMFLIPKFGTALYPWVEETDKMNPRVLARGESMSLPAGDFVLGSTIERVSIPNDLVGRVEGKSSLGRLGLFVHVTAGYIDPGFSGYITLELFAARPIRLRAGMQICQISFEALDRPTMRPYGHDGLAHYQNQKRGPVKSTYGGDDFTERRLKQVPDGLV